MGLHEGQLPSCHTTQQVHGHCAGKGYRNVDSCMLSFREPQHLLQDCQSWQIWGRLLGYPLPLQGVGRLQGVLYPSRTHSHCWLFPATLRI